jgi:hypothetical protein
MRGSNKNYGKRELFDTSVCDPILCQQFYFSYSVPSQILMWLTIFLFSYFILPLFQIIRCLHFFRYMVFAICLVSDTEIRGTQITTLKCLDTWVRRGHEKTRSQPYQDHTKPKSRLVRDQPRAGNTFLICQRVSRSMCI